MSAVSISMRLRQKLEKYLKPGEAVTLPIHDDDELSRAL